MSTTKKDQLFDLIQSLTKAEKRSFKLYAGRLQSNEDVKFVQLFDLLDKMHAYDERAVLGKIPGLNKSRLTNLKRHLYNQLLTSLRLLHKDSNLDIQLREQIDYARILYEKGLYIQSLKLLERAKDKASTSQRHILQLEIIEFVKYIEERHITRSRRVAGKLENLLHEADILERNISNIVRLSNLKIRIHGLYITMGHARNQKDHYVVSEYFQSELEKIDEKTLTATEQIYLHQCYMWYYYILLDLDKCNLHAVQWADLFDANPELKQLDPVLYMRGLSYVLTTLFSQRKQEQYLEHLQRFEQFSKEYSKSFTTTQEIIRFMYLYTARINKHILTESFGDGLNLVDEVNKKLLKYEKYLDVHRVMVFNYKIAQLLFGAGDYGGCIDYLNRILNLQAGHLREDIQCYARLMMLLAHYELGHYDLLPYQVESVSRFFDKMEDLNEVQRTILNFFRQGASVDEAAKVADFKKLRKSIEKLNKNPYERRAFQHLDILRWIDGKL